MKLPSRKLILIVTATAAFALSIGIGFGLQVPHRSVGIATSGASHPSDGQAPAQSNPPLTGSQFLETTALEVRTGPGGFPIDANAQPHGVGSRAAQALIEERGLAWLIPDPSFRKRNLRAVTVYSVGTDLSQVRAFYEGNPAGTPWYLTSSYDSMEFNNGSNGDSAIVHLLTSAQASDLGVPSQSFVLLLFG